MVDAEQVPPAIELKQLWHRRSKDAGLVGTRGKHPLDYRRAYCVMTVGSLVTHRLAPILTNLVGIVVFDWSAVKMSPGAGMLG